MAKRKACEVSTYSSRVAEAQVRADAPNVKQSSIGGGSKDGKLIQRLNDMAMHDFNELYVDPEWLVYRPAASTMELRIDLKPSATLSPEELSSCYDLVEETSRPDYENSSFGWHPRRKRKEMKEPEMRFLLVQEPTARKVQGFLSFMLTHDSTPSVPVLYIYEIHLADRLRKVGLGARLMQGAEDIAHRVGVEKVMLTCFVSNGKARGFYEKHGYAMDECSPEDRRTRHKTVKADYVIMSKRVHSP